MDGAHSSLSSSFILGEWPAVVKLFKRNFLLVSSLITARALLLLAFHAMNGCDCHDIQKGKKNPGQQFIMGLSATKAV